MLSTYALNGLREYVKSTLAYAKYKIGSTYYQEKLTDVTVRSDGKVRVEFTINPTVKGEIKIAEVQLYNTAGQLWWSKTESITRKTSQEGIYYRVTINITEE